MEYFLLQRTTIYSQLQQTDLQNHRHNLVTFYVPLLIDVTRNAVALLQRFMNISSLAKYVADQSTINPLQSTLQPSSKYQTTLFKVPYNPLQSTIQPSSKYHTHDWFHL